MASSSKFRSATPSRYHSGPRWHTQRQIIMLLAIVMLVSSASMLVFHIVSRPFASRSDNDASCNSDSDYSIIHWSNRNHAPVLDGSEFPSGLRDRPRVALPGHGSEIDKVIADAYEQAASPPPAPAASYAPNNNYDNSNNNDNSRYMPNTGNVYDNTNNQQDSNGLGQGSSEEDEGSEQNANAEQDLVDEPVVYAPFSETLMEIADDVEEKYVTYLPYAGITNQFYGMLRGMHLAKALGRTLIIPPITASSHDKSKQNQPWSRFLDLERFMDLTGTKVVEFHQLRDVEVAEMNELQCGITCGFGSKRTIDFTAKGFLKQWKFNVNLIPLRTDANKLNTIVSSLDRYRQDKFICISNTYKIAVADKSEWTTFGQHLYFTPELESFVQDFLSENLAQGEEVYDPTTQSMKKATQPYIAIHARRGDFSEYCKNNFKAEKLIHCLPSTEQIADRVDEVQEKSGSSEMMPVFVATNERRPEELKKFADLGWQYLDHDAMGTVDALGIFGPMMADQVFMAHAEALIGIQMSTFSRVGALRQRDWHDREVEYM